MSRFSVRLIRRVSPLVELVRDALVLDLLGMSKLMAYQHVIVVYHVTIVAIGHGLLKKFWPMVIGCVLRTTGGSII